MNKPITNVFHGNIFNLTKTNDNFRNVLTTGENSQVVLMSLLPNEDIGKETHDVDQILIFVEGEGTATIDEKKYTIKPGDLFFVSAGLTHNFKNIGKSNLKLFTIYAPTEHKQGLIQKLKPKE